MIGLGKLNLWFHFILKLVGKDIQIQLCSLIRKKNLDKKFECEKKSFVFKSISIFSIFSYILQHHSFSMNELKMILMPIVTSELVRGEEGRERFGHALQCYQL